MVSLNDPAAKAQEFVRELASEQSRATIATEHAKQDAMYRASAGALVVCVALSIFLVCAGVAQLLHS